MKIPARCNRRACQSRRNLSMRPEQYKYWPKCNVCREGRMYVDEYRLRKGPRDHAPICRDDACKLLIATHRKRPLMYHLVSTKGCIGNEDYLFRKAARGTVKNSPVQEHYDEEPPF